MKKDFLFLVLFVIGFTIVSAQNGPPITLVNNTGNNISKIILRCSYREADGRTTTTEKAIEFDPFLHGQSFTTNLPVPLNKASSYTIELVYGNGQRYKMNNVSVSANAVISLGTGSSSGDSISGKGSSSGGSSGGGIPCTMCGATGICPLCKGAGWQFSYGMYMACVMCNGSGKCGICKGLGYNIYSGKNGGDFTGGDGSNGGGGSGRTRTCDLCLGEGRVYEYTGTGANDMTRVICNICNITQPHKHATCNRCKGTGKLSL